VDGVLGSLGCNGDMVPIPPAINRRKGGGYVELLQAVCACEKRNTMILEQLCMSSCGK
jgi:hypothetical protein